METVAEKIDTAALPIKIEFVAKTIKNDFGEKPWECLEWRVTLSSKSGSWTVPYFCGMAHVKPRKARHQIKTQCHPAQSRPAIGARNTTRNG